MTSLWSITPNVNHRAVFMKLSSKYRDHAKSLKHKLTIISGFLGKVVRGKGWEDRYESFKNKITAITNNICLQLNEKNWNVRIKVNNNFFLKTQPNNFLQYVCMYYTNLLLVGLTKLQKRDVKSTLISRWGKVNRVNNHCFPFFVE